MCHVSHVMSLANIAAFSELSASIAWILQFDHISPVQSTDCRPDYTRLHQTTPDYTRLHQTTTDYTRLHQTAPDYSSVASFAESFDWRMFPQLSLATWPVARATVKAGHAMAGERRQGARSQELGWGQSVGQAARGRTSLECQEEGQGAGEGAGTETGEGEMDRSGAGPRASAGA